MTKLVVVSGGTATNSLVSLLQSISNEISYILPISDNGGSTSEIVRVLGGPAIGDIRSRITRLIPDNEFKDLLSYRLDEDNELAKNEWTEIVEGNHSIWSNIQPQCKEIIRSFLIHVHMELLKKSRNLTTNFRFELASIGNLLLTGIRLFVGSLDSAIELLLRLTRIPSKIQIIPCLNTNYTYNISALLENNEIITGQSQISHPIESHPSNLSNLSSQDLLHENYEDIPYQHPELMKSQLKFSKYQNSPLPSPIKKIFYINSYGEEIHPVANSRTIQNFKNSDVIIYSIGSLMTSILPVLILKNVGNAIKSSVATKKILILNGCYDRETFNLTAWDFLVQILNSVKYSEKEKENIEIKLSDIITHLIYLNDCEINVDVDKINNYNIETFKVEKQVDGFYDLDDLRLTLLKIINS